MKVQAYAVDEITEKSRKIGKVFSVSDNITNMQIFEKEKELENIYSNQLKFSEVIQLEEI